VTQYEHTQIGHVIIWSLFVPAVLFAINATFGSSPHRESLLVVSVVLLITLALFYKLTITINEEALCASFGIGMIRKRVSVAEIAACGPIRIRWWYGWGNSSDAVRLALQCFRIGRRSDHVAQRPKIRVRH